MKVSLQPALNDANIDVARGNSQRQLSVSVVAISPPRDRPVGLNLCLVLDRSGSMRGNPLTTVKQAAKGIVEQMSPGDRLSIVSFNHRAQVLASDGEINDRAGIKAAIDQLQAEGGTAIDEGLKLGIEQLAKGDREAISQIFLLTDGENEHGDNSRCFKLAQLATEYNITLNGLGFGDHWNQDVIEAIADAGGGSLSYIETPERAIQSFNDLFERIQSVRLTNARLLLSPSPKVRLAELKPVAQVSPETIELPVRSQGGVFSVRLGDLMTDEARVVVANLYIGRLPQGRQPIADLQVCYDDPATGDTNLHTRTVAVEANVLREFKSAPNSEVQRHVWALAKYRQTQIAEQKLKQGDRAGAATMLQTAAKTSLQMGDDSAATVLQDNATRLQAGGELSEGDRKKTRIVSKTMMQRRKGDGE